MFPANSQQAKAWLSGRSPADRAAVSLELDEDAGLYWGYIGRMENNMETAIIVPNPKP